MTTLTITRGLTGSGKTTWARAHAEQTGALRVNRDDTRMMLFGKKVGLTYAQENAVTTAVRTLVSEYLKAGHDVVADDMNLRPVYVREWRKLAKSHGAEFVVQPFEISVDDAIARQSGRPVEDRVPGDVIRNMAKKYLRKETLLPVMDEVELPDDVLVYSPPKGDQPHAIICDIDGTVALMSGRSPYDLTRVHEDQPNTPVVNAVVALYLMGYEVIFLSGREDVAREATEKWLKGYFPDITWKLFMRAADDKRRDSIVKKEIFDTHVRHHYKILSVFDDRRQVVEMWRSIGLTCFQVADGDF